MLPFNRRPPQSNCPSETVLQPANGMELEFQFEKSGISLMTPQIPKELVLRLPPILRKSNQNAISEYSKAS